MWVIFNKRRKKTGFIDISKEDPRSMPLLTDKLNRQLENGYETLEFSVPSSHEKAALLEKEGFIAYTKDNKKFRLFRIKKMGTSRGIEQNKVVMCETASTTDLRGAFVPPVTFTSTAVGVVAQTILAPAGWELGICESIDLITIEFKDYPSVLEAIRALAEQVDLELEFEVELDKKNNIKRMVVNLYKKRGRVTREIVEYRKNMEGFKKNEDTNDLVTAILCVGGEDDNGNPIRIINAQVQPPEGFQIIDDMIVNLSALEEWGDNGRNIVGKYVNTEAQNAVDLYNGGLEELKKKSKPAVDYEVEARLINLNADIGDTIVVKDFDFEIPEIVEARVLELSESITNPDNDSITLGEFVKIKVNPIKVISDLQKVIKQKETAWDKSRELAEQAAEDAAAAKNVKTVKVEGVQQFNNGQGQIVYRCAVFLDGTEIDINGEEYYYLWSMYDITNTKIEGYERSGKTLTLAATEFNKRVNLQCEAFEMEALTNG
jgi:phage minor structural protein